jgi:hypothetical protein
MIDEVKLLRNEIIENLKKSDWEGSEDSFKNKNFEFEYSSLYGWSIKIYPNPENRYSYNNLKLNEIISNFHFWFLREFYVKKSLKEFEERKKKSRLILISKEFFEKNPDIKRDQKLNQLLTKK